MPIVGGGETYTLELMMHFAEQGWDVHLATASVVPYASNPLQSATVHYIEGFDDSHQEFEKCLPALRTLLDTLRPDIVHVHNILPYFAYSSIVSEYEFPTVLTIHNTPDIPNRIFGTYHDYLTEAAFTRQLLSNNKCQMILVGSKFYMDSYASVVPQLARKNRAEVAHYFPPSLATGQSGEETNHETRSEYTIILFPSRLIKRKGIEDALHAVAKLPASYKLSIPGYNSPENVQYKDEVDMMIRFLDIESKLIIPPSRTLPQDMAAHYRQADIVIVPSHYEGFGIVAVEAMHHKRPLISTNVGGLAEIVQDGYNALVVPPQDPVGIINAIQRITIDDTLRELLIRNAVVTINSRFSRDKHMKKIEKVYHDIAQRD